MSRQGVRIEWGEVPATVRGAVDGAIGSPIVRTHGTEGGFSPGPAVRAELADGRTVFVKAAGTSLNRHAPAMHRREAEILRSLPPSIPAPRLLGTVDDGDWVALVIEWVDGRLPEATNTDDVSRVVALLERVASRSAGVEMPTLVSAGRARSKLSGHWARLRDDPLPGLDEWSQRHLDRLIELDARALDACSGDHLVHGDVRTDNVLLAASGVEDDVLVDWPSASIGASWLDLVGMLPALHLDGGPAPSTVFDAQPAAHRADPAMVDAYVASLAGYFTRQSLLPPPSGLPTLRGFQAAQGEVTRRWLAERVGLR